MYSNGLQTSSQRKIHGLDLFKINWRKERRSRGQNREGGRSRKDVLK